MEGLKQSRGPATSAAVIVNHPVRSRCWHFLAERVGSPAEMAREFGEDVGLVGYHVRVLRDLGFVELVDEKPVRGAVEHFYRATERPEITAEEADQMSPEAATRNATLVQQLLFADTSLSLESGKFVERAEHIIMRYPMTVDETGWGDVAELYEEMVERLYGIQAECVDRLDGAKGIRVTAGGLLFERAPTAEANSSEGNP